MNYESTVSFDAGLWKPTAKQILFNSFEFSDCDSN